MVSYKFFLPTVLFSFLTLTLLSQEKSTLSGYVKDNANGETLIGATIYIEELKSGTSSNAYGFYSLTLPDGEYNLKYSFVGYNSISKKILLNGNMRLDIELKESEQSLDEVVVNATRESEDLTPTEQSTVKLDIKTIQKIPAFLGEIDLFKSLQLLPGVSTVGEGASGFNVRGGGVGQNLILLDEAPVYNPSHLLGIFSVFNPDAVKEIKLYKGGIPARYGGRISSILDVRMKEGNSKNYKVTSGIGTIFSRFAVEGPIIKGKSSFILAGRRSYADILAKTFTNFLDNGEKLNFYDVTFKTNFQVGKNDRLFLSGYLGRDVFQFDENQGFNWGNKTATLRWNHLFNDRLFWNTSLIGSDYDYELSFGQTAEDQFDWSSDIVTYDLKSEVSYFPNQENEITIGGEAILYRFRPANAVGISNGEVADVSIHPQRALELALYASNQQKITGKLDVEYGLRFSSFQYLGDGPVYTFNDTIPGIRRSVTSVRQADNFESIVQYGNLEPRLSASYKLSNETSLKASYNLTAQYIHLISNTTASNPLDLWIPSTNNIEPQTGQQWTLGYFKKFAKRKYEASLETYFRKTKNQIDYINGAEILINEFLEGDVLSGDGRAYGAEFYFKKNSGKFNGWISYTLSRTELKVGGINNGEWYPTRFDQLHNLKVVAFYDLSEQWSISGNFAFTSGTPTTFPNSRFRVQGIVIPHIANNERFNRRIPDYHKLDLSVTREGRAIKKNGKRRKVKDNLVFTVYNVYARNNPFSIYFSSNNEGAFNNPNTEARQVSIIGTFIPSITYNLSFLP